MAKRRAPKYLRAGEDDRLIAAAPTDRDKMILRVGLLMGLRVSEIVKLRIEDLDVDGGTALIARAKGDKDRYVPIPAKLLDPLIAYIGDRIEGPVFLSRFGRQLTTRTVQLMVKDAAAKAGITRRTTPHHMRHTYATRLLNKGANLREVQDLLGHASISTTEIYTHVAVDRLRGAVERL